MFKHRRSNLLKMALSTGLVTGLLGISAVSFADGIIQLRPLQPGYGDNTYSYDSSNSYYQNTPISLRGQITSIPQGTLLMIRMDQPITSYAGKMGDPVSATLENDVFVNDTIVIPAGSQVLGQVVHVDEASRLGQHGSIDIRFHAVKMQDGRNYPIRAHVVTSDDTGILKGDSYVKDIAKGVGIAAGGTGVGTLMGTAAGSLIGSAGAGAVFGLGVGALGGMGYALARKGKEVVIPSQARMSLMLDAPVSIGN